MKVESRTRGEGYLCSDIADDINALITVDDQVMKLKHHAIASRDHTHTHTKTKTPSTLNFPNSRVSFLSNTLSLLSSFVPRLLLLILSPRGSNHNM
ncbi:hypothetical protein VNO78_19601 [Psophocarpus tetragonolobus]|uniref:Uncharacterized protein n=1 Tax=Psophocarpus tetragonolobus TaxID=3891 RepID=A0AAN9S7T3_PSOTE